MHPPDHKHESILAGRLMTLMAGKVTENLLTFSTWLVVSYSAFLAFLIAHLDVVSKFVPVSSLGSSGRLLLAAIAVHVVQRYLAAIVSGGVSMAKDAESTQFREGLDMTVVMREIENSTFWPARFFVRRNFEKLRGGDYAGSGRNLGRLAQLQGFMTIVQVLVIMFAAYIVVEPL